MEFLRFNLLLNEYRNDKGKILPTDSAKVLSEVVFLSDLSSCMIPDIFSDVIPEIPLYPKPHLLIVEESPMAYDLSFDNRLTYDRIKSL